MAGGELGNERLVEFSILMVFDILNAGRGEVEVGGTNEAEQLVAFAGCPFGIHEQPEAFLEGEIRESNVLLLITKCCGHDGKAHLDELVHGCLIDRGFFLP